MAAAAVGWRVVGDQCGEQILECDSKDVWELGVQISLLIKITGFNVFDSSCLTTPSARARTRERVINWL